MFRFSLRRILVSLFLAPLASAVQADVIADWNARVDVLSMEQRLAPPYHVRALALMHVAMFEAVNAIDGRYQPYRLKLSTDRNSSREAAAAAAAHGVVSALFPAKGTELDTLLATTLNAIPEGPAKQRGLLLGRKAAADMLALRANDGSDVADAWRPLTQPGRYIPTSLAVGSAVASLQPWVMRSPSEFRPGPPVALTSETWTRDYNEIRELGGLDSKRRTPEQTDIAKFWFLTGPRTFNPLLQQCALANELDLLDRARLYALVSMAAADAFIAVFEAKHFYNFWRPVTAIRNGDITGNPGTPRESGWLPLGETPMHPEYPCAHCIGSTSVATVITGLYGDEPAEWSVTHPVSGVTRRWSRLAEYRDEVSNARIWAGFHYRFSTEVAQDMGRRIAERTLATQLLPRK